MSVYSDEIGLPSTKENTIVDITPHVQECVGKSGIRNGIVCVFVPGSTGAITTLEYEPGLVKDIPLTLERLFPRNIKYHHDDTWHDGNGHSHVRAAMIGPSITVPVRNGQLTLGTWQQIVFIELDVRSRNRKIIVQVIGET